MKILYILFVLLLFYIYVIIDKNREGLQDIGEPYMSANGPIPYKTFVNMLKYPNRIEKEKLRVKIKEITRNHPFVPKNFRSRKRQYRRLYKNKIMKNDFKYFNNSTNLLLYNYHNKTNDQKF